MSITTQISKIPSITHKEMNRLLQMAEGQMGNDSERLAKHADQMTDDFGSGFRVGYAEGKTELWRALMMLAVENGDRAQKVNNTSTQPY